MTCSLQRNNSNTEVKKLLDFFNLFFFFLLCCSASAWGWESGCCHIARGFAEQKTLEELHGEPEREQLSVRGCILLTNPAGTRFVPSSKCQCSPSCWQCTTLYCAHVLLLLGVSSFTRDGIAKNMSCIMLWLSSSSLASLWEPVRWRDAEQQETLKEG